MVKNHSQPERKSIKLHIQYSKVYLVVADLMHGCDLFLQPTVELKAQLPSIHFKASGQCTQLCH